jgi:cellulose biosynthesis protein BcsQ
MTSIAFFNNKGGVGKTTLVYHVACMLSEIGVRALAVDLDPQANLTSAFLDEPTLESLWNSDKSTILRAVEPILEGIGDIADIDALEVRDDLYLIVGDLGLSRFEDRLSESWSKGFAGDPAALRVTSAFHRIIQRVAEQVRAEVVLMDVGPNLGAINRASLLAANHLLIPLAADLYSLQGLRNLGPTVRKWKADWQRAIDSAEVSFSLPAGEMSPVGYVVLQHAIRLDRPVKAYRKWLDRIPSEYRKSVLGNKLPIREGHGVEDPNRLASLRNYRSLMPLAQDARKPMFDLKPADGAIGSHAQYVQTCFAEFRDLTKEILRRMQTSSR